MKTSGSTEAQITAIMHWGVFGFDAKQLAGCDTATGVRGSE